MRKRMSGLPATLRRAQSEPILLMGAIFPIDLPRLTKDPQTTKDGPRLGNNHTAIYGSYESTIYYMNGGMLVPGT